MNSKIVLVQLLLIFFIIQPANSQTITKVLQNGNGTYEGCEDSYTNSESPDINYNDKPYLKHKNCQA